jgi:hypothetical protein
MGIRQLEQIALKHHHKKILSEILRLRTGMAVPANKSEDRSPITFTKLVESFVRFMFFAS